jgi:hypothetical protein
MRRFIVTLLHTNGTTSTHVVDSYASEWYVLQSMVAHHTNIQSHDIMEYVTQNDFTDESISLTC